MDKFYELLKENKREILDKFSYYTKRFQNISYEMILKKYSRELDSGVFPRILEKRYPIIEGLKTTVLYTIADRNELGQISLASTCYVEDKINPSKIWILYETEHQLYKVEKTNFFCITKHYLDRFEERNPTFKLFVGNSKEAAAIDLGLALEKRLAFFVNIDLISDMPNYEEEKKDIINFIELIKEVEPDLYKYFSLEKSTGILRTMDGYGIYKVEDTKKIVMMTWLSEKMLTNNQRRVFQYLTPEKSLY